MKIVFLFWGSLTWDNEILKLKKNYKLPIKLPLNFSRISKDGRITLVIDQDNGTKGNVYYSQTDINNLNNAINILKKRENTNKNNIGYININNKRYRNKNLSNDELDFIYKYFKIKKIDGVVWTDLSTNWYEKRDEYFSNNNAINYIEENMKNKKKINLIKEYIINCFNYAKFNNKLVKYVLLNLTSYK